MKAQKLRALPSLENDGDAERFVATADLTKYDLSGFRPMRFEFEEKTATLNIRLPQNLLKAVKAKAENRGIPYSRYIRSVLEQAVAL